MYDPSPSRPPATVYWRRRAVAAGGVALALVVVGWAAGGFLDDPESAPAATRTGAARHSRPPSVLPRAAASSTSAATTTAPIGTPPGTPPAGDVATTDQNAPGLPAAAAPPPGPPAPCHDASIQVIAEADAPEYRVGQRPGLRLVIANTGALPCVRAVGRELRELLVMTQDGANRLWSSNDCYASLGAEEHTFAPGERLTFTVRWAGRTSAPGCPAGRHTVPAGAYVIVGRLGALTSPPAPIRFA